MKILLPFFIAPLVASIALGQVPGPAPANPTAGALHAFFEAEWDYEMAQNPTRASSLGDRR